MQDTLSIDNTREFRYLILIKIKISGISGITYAWAHAQSLNHVPLFVAPWTAACQVPLPMGILQARILEWVTTPSSRGSSRPRDWTCISCIAAGFFYCWATVEREREHCSVVSDSLQPHGLYCPWNSPGQNTGVTGEASLIITMNNQNEWFHNCFLSYD